MTKRDQKYRIPGIVPTALLACSMLVACGPNQVKGEAPFVQVTAWSIDGTLLLADLRVRNINDVPTNVEHLQLRVMLKDVELIDYAARHPAEVSANGFEIIKLEMTASDEGTQLLADLQNGDLKSLPYTMDGTVETAKGKKHKFHRKGHIYTVPGKPGQFR